MSEIDTEDARLLIRVLRALQDWSRGELAERSGVAQISIRRYENGESVPSHEVLDQLAEAAHLPGYFVRGALLSVLQLARRLAFPTLKSGADYARLQAGADAYAQEAAELARGFYLRSWFRSTLDEETKRTAGELEAWHPAPEHRLESELLWLRLEPCSPADRVFLLDDTATFRSWALAERIADQAVEEAARDAARAEEWARLALEIALRVRGAEGWPERVQGYACAALAAVQRAIASDAANDAEAARSAARALELWQRGAGFPGLLDEPTFAARLGLTSLS